VLSSALFWFVVAIFVAGHLLLIRSAWRLRHSPADLPAGVPRSDARSDLAWTLLTALASAALLVAVFYAIG
jgi:heme/copper-type cytochrome/quinol oxidase subunit 2